MPGVRNPTRSSKRQLKQRNTIHGIQMFQHSALDIFHPRVRLFRLLPKMKDGNLRLELHNNVSLGWPLGLRFRALSYEWGPSRPRRAVLVNGKPFLIRKNLHTFLEHLHEHFGGLRLQFMWADAICIDQDNLAERNHQVQRMRNIYGQAVELLAWTGSLAQPADGDLFETLNRCLSEGKRRDHGSFRDPLRNDPERCATLLAFCNRSYWSRLMNRVRAHML